jgi:hypothetical protein
MIIYNKEGNVISSKDLKPGEFYLLRDVYKNNYGRSFEAIVTYKGQSHNDSQGNYEFQVISIYGLAETVDYIPSIGHIFGRRLTDSDITIREL